MAYTTWSDVKAYLGTTATTQSSDYSLISDLRIRAQKVIDIYTGREFDGSATTRYFTVGEDTDGRELYLDKDLCKITKIKSNCDGTTVTINSTEYITLPRNETPYYMIRLLSSTTNSWDYTDDPENGIQIKGSWYYSTSIPEDIQQAAVRLTAYYYRQKDANVFDVTAIPEAGVIEIPQGIPRDVKMILDPYRKII